MSTKRLRVFAGPNGSGKSTLKRHVTSKFSIPFGYFVNADDIERNLRTEGYFDFAVAGLRVSQDEFARFAEASSLTERTGQTDWLTKMQVQQNRLSLPNVAVNSYHAALVADFLREKLLAAGLTFSIETVLSDPRKLDFLAKARAAGYRVYLYFVATDSPEININRVSERVAAGGHDVPSSKVRQRYERTLQLLPRVVALTDRAYIFDNSQALEFVAEITDGTHVEFQNGDLPAWIDRFLQG